MTKTWGWGLGLGLAMLACGAFFYCFETADENREPPAASLAASHLSVPELDTIEKRQAIFQDQIAPVLESENARSHEATLRCVERVSDFFHTYRQGIDPFVDDIASTWTRFGILKRMPSDWWHDEDQVTEYIRDKFEKHLFQESKLNQDISNALIAWRDELRADRNQLLADVKVAISISDLPDIQIPEQSEFEEEIRQALIEMTKSQASESIYAGISSLVASEIASAVSMSLIARMVASIGSSTAVAAGSAGGATAGGAATGAGGGSFAGPAGTVVGLAVGIVVGVSIDWWMTNRFKERLRSEILDYLVGLETKLINGHEDLPGLKSTLERVRLDLQQLQRQAIRRRVLGGTSAL